MSRVEQNTGLATLLSALSVRARVKTKSFRNEASGIGSEMRLEQEDLHG